MRVEIPAYHDYWMKGDRYGVLVKTTTRAGLRHPGPEEVEIAHVRLDKSNLVIRVLLDECTVLS